ncbi:AAA family ATPase [Aeromonas caviae]|uniref:AAA family ATPase n=1 Tax=Aeromonas caviae TaxID=648 RepID=UPI003EC91A60
MIERFYARNYKSFPSLELDLKNINILLGSNSCGKSSITKLLLMLSQTADSTENYNNILRPNGSKTSLGEAINIFADKSHDKEFTVGWSLPDDLLNKEDPAFTHLNEILEYIAARHSNLFFNLDQDRRSEYEKTYHKYFKSIYRNRANIFKLNIFSNDKVLSDIKENISHSVRDINKFTKFNMDLNVDIFEANDIINTKSTYTQSISIARLKELIDFFTILQGNNIIPKTIEYNIGYNQKREECELNSLRLLDYNGIEIIGVIVSNNKKIDLSSDVFDLNVLSKSRMDIVRGIDYNNPLLLKDNTLKTNGEINLLAHYIRAFISSTINRFLGELCDTSINHVSPLRAFPQRYYLLEKSAQHNTLNSNDGSQLAEILKNNKQILNKVNELFMEFGIKISTARTNDIIHRITVKQQNVTVELTDVGFGISQVLPILVQALLSPHNTITIIEQPEIHLHPKMQAWLTNALVNISISENKKFIIETHSDTIIKRLQILFLEPNNGFDKQNLNIFHLERDGDGYTKLNNVPFNDLGEIQWPKDFMSLEIDDTIKLQRLKVQKIKEINQPV